MSRIACLYVPAVSLQALARVEPDLRDEIVVITDTLGPRAKVIALTPSAYERGVREGMSVTQSRAVAGEIAVRVRSPAATRSASDALVDVARSFAAKIERAAHDLLYLEVGDLRRLFPRETALAAAIEATSRKVGLVVRLGIAGTKTAARLAALRSEDGAATIVPSGVERHFLAGLPVSLAEPPAELARALSRFGLHTLGEVAALPTRGLGRRLGREGALLWRLARGEDDESLHADPEPESFSEGIDLDYALDSTEPLSFVLRGSLSRICARLETRGLACACFHLVLRLSTRGEDSREIPVAAPTTDASVLTTLARLSLERQPPPAPVCGLVAIAFPSAAEYAQLTLFGPILPSPGKLAATIAKLCAMCGPDRVGAPSLIDSHLPQAEAVMPFAPQASLPVGSDGRTPPRVIALRRIRPAQNVRVFTRDGLPISLNGEPLVRATGPWRLDVQWWSDSALARDYFDVETASGVVYRLFQEDALSSWQIDGVYD